ncbi:hypothetical protein EWH99_03170 [Sporolactobacillus sp. THM7-7]|nr:hypothetical protein EWH99_03170 [Sporolactobacillus sp. THM7-7]
MFLLRKSYWNDLSMTKKYVLNLVFLLLLMFLFFALSSVLLVMALQKVDDAGKEGDRVVQITEIGSLFRSKDTRVVDYLLNPGDKTVKLYTRECRKRPKP